MNSTVMLNFPKKAKRDYHLIIQVNVIMMFLLPEMRFLISDVLSRYKLTSSKHILMVS